MPKCRPLIKKTIAEQAKAALPNAETMRRRIRSLQDLCGYKNQLLFGEAIGIDARRLRTIADNPATCRLEEAMILQEKGEQVGVKIFDRMSLSEVRRGV